MRTHSYTFPWRSPGYRSGSVWQKPSDGANVCPRLLPGEIFLNISLLLSCARLFTEVLKNLPLSFKRSLSVCLCGATLDYNVWNVQRHPASTLFCCWHVDETVCKSGAGWMYMSVSACLCLSVCDPSRRLPRAQETVARQFHLKSVPSQCCSAAVGAFFCIFVFNICSQ